MAGLEEWYYEMPLVTRVYLTASIVTTGSCALECAPPFSLPCSGCLPADRATTPALQARLSLFAVLQLQSRRLQVPGRDPSAPVSTAPLGSRPPSGLALLLCPSRCGGSLPTSSSLVRSVSTFSSTCFSSFGTAACLRRAASAAAPQTLSQCCSLVRTPHLALARSTGPPPLLERHSGVSGRTRRWLPVPCAGKARHLRPDPDPDPDPNLT